MVPDSALPGPLPLEREGGLRLVNHLDQSEAPPGTFLTFVMIPIEDRIGEWRFAGATTSLAESVRQVGRFWAALGVSYDEGMAMLHRLLEPEEWEEGWHFPPDPPVEVSGPHRLILCVQGEAPYDDVGVSIVEVASLAGSGYEGRAPSTERPEEWEDAEQG